MKVKSCLLCCVICGSLVAQVRTSAFGQTYSVGGAETGAAIYNAAKRNPGSGKAVTVDEETLKEAIKLERAREEHRNLIIEEKLRRKQERKERREKKEAEVEAVRRAQRDKENAQNDRIQELYDANPMPGNRYYVPNGNSFIIYSYPSGRRLGTVSKRPKRLGE